MLVRFHSIDFPDRCIFDETFFGNFTNYYHKHEYFVDIHPPLGKLVLYFGSKIVGYKGDLEFSYIQQQQYSNQAYISIRCVNALFSSVGPSIIYLSLRLNDLSPITSFTASLMLSFETLAIVEGRYILTDGILTGFACIAIFAVIAQGRLSSEFSPILAIGISFVISTKQTSWGIFVVAFYIYLLKAFQKHKTNSITFSLIYNTLRPCIFLVLICAIIYFFWFWLHDILIPIQTKDSVHVCPGLLFSNTNETWNFCRSQNVFKRLITLMAAMNKINLETINDNDLSSRWYQWPLLHSSPMRYLNEDNRVIAEFTQPFNGFFGFFSLVAFIVLGYFFVLEKRDQGIEKFWIRSALFVVGYAASYLPFMLISRSTFNYHYIIPLVFLFCLTGCLLEIVKRKWQKLGIIFSISVCISTTICFLIYSPWIYGMQKKTDYLLLRKSWSINQ